MTGKDYLPRWSPNGRIAVLAELCPGWLSAWACDPRGGIRAGVKMAVTSPHISQRVR